MSEHQDAIAATLRRRIQDSAVRQSRLLAQAHDEEQHRMALTDELWSLGRQPITIHQLTVAEREAATNAAHLALTIIDNGEDG